MRTNDAGISIIKRWEGCRLQAYQCPSKVWTIGYGHTGNVIPGDKITMAVADSLLRSDLIKFERSLDSYGLPLNENQYSAMVSLMYNIGQGNFAKSNVLKLARVNVNDPRIQDAFLKHVYSAGKILQGLVNRRNDEIKLYFKQI